MAQRALALRETAYGPAHPGGVSSPSNLALLYDNQGSDAEAEPLCARVLAIREKVVREARGHPFLDMGHIPR